MPVGSDLRPYQLEAIDNIRASVRSGVRRMVLQAPTGSGKTKIAAALASSALTKGNRLAFVVPAISLVDQTVEEFYEAGISDVGVIQANHIMTDWSKPVQVCSIQTIQRRGQYPECGAVIFDECHRLYEAQKKWLTDSQWSGVPMLGLSATPWSKGLGRYYDSLLVVATTQELIDGGYLCPFKMFATGHPDLSKVRVVAGDYHEGELSAAMSDSGLTADIIRTWKELWGKPKTLCFAVDKAHAQCIQARFQHAGINAGYQDAETPPAERAEIRRRFHSGDYPVVVNIQTLTTGVDWDVRCLILARPTRSEILYTQIIGRALRLGEGKEHAIILDHSDSTQRLGFVTDIHHEHLDDGKTKPKAVAKPKEKQPIDCKQCGFIRLQRTRSCPNCGAELKIESSIMERDGRLRHIWRDGSMHMAAKVPARDWTDDERRTFLAELKAYAAQRGYKPGWAAFKYKEKFREWPGRAIEWVKAAEVVSPTVALWVRSRQIAYARAKASQTSAVNS